MIPTRITENTLILTGKALVVKASVKAGASVAAYVQVFDNLSATGDPIAEVATAKNESDNTGTLRVPTRIGIYALITGAGASAVIYRE